VWSPTPVPKAGYPNGSAIVAAPSDQTWSIGSSSNVIPLKRPTAGSLERLLALAQSGAGRTY
jgi:hypothetical protein